MRQHRHSVGSRAVSISSRAVIGCLGVIGCADFILRRWKAPPLAVVAALDEPAHVCTGVLALSALGETFELPVVVAVVAGSVAIDLDHVPGMLGSDMLVVPGPTRTRPVAHSLTSLAVLGAASLLLRGTPRQPMLVTAAAMALHYFRDITEPSRAGMPVLWPVSDRVYSLGYFCYVAALLTLAAVALSRRACGRQVRRVIGKRS